MNFKNLLINLYVILANAQIMTQDFTKRLNNLHTAIEFCLLSLIQGCAFDKSQSRYVSEQMAAWRDKSSWSFVFTNYILS